MMYTQSTPPPQAQYVAALQAIQSNLSDREIAVLRFQFQQLGRAITSQDVRDYFGYPNIGASNLLYGSLGKRIASALPMETGPEGAARPKFWKALSTGDGGGDHYIWIMRPELAGALIEIGLVDPSTDGLVNVQDLDIHPSNVSAVEGRLKLVMHLVRERNRQLVLLKKASAQSHACEICGFDSIKSYGIDYCEVHHLTPIAQLETDSETSLEDLAILCANCHRIIHLASPPMTIEELRYKLISHA